MSLGLAVSVSAGRKNGTPVSGAEKSQLVRMAGAPSKGGVGSTERHDGKECAGCRKPVEDLPQNIAINPSSLSKTHKGTRAA